MGENDVPCCDYKFWIYVIAAASLVSVAGLMSGLTLGLMSLSALDLEVLAKSGQPKDRVNAEKILPLVRNKHLLLSSLVIYNSLAAEALPIFIDALIPAWASILMSATLILAFGEIVPQAICSRHGLSIGAKLCVLVRLLVFLIFPIAYPISKVLDWVIGKDHNALLRRCELKAFVDLHSHHAGKGGELTNDEITIIGGALELTTKTAKEAMTPLSKVFSLDIDAKLNRETIELIMRKGHRRVPVYSGKPNNIVGLILIKSVIVCGFEDEALVRNHAITKISRIYDYLPLFEVLNQLKKSHSHMGIVVGSKHALKDMSSEATSNSVMKGNPEKSETKDMLVVGIDNFTGTIHGHHTREQKKATRNTSIVNSAKIQSFDLPEIDTAELSQSTIMYQKDATILEVPDLECSLDSSEEAIGIITMEDIMEELLQEEIYDEDDDYEVKHNK